MQAVGRLGSYISQGVYTVSGPFHPFGGAVDIVVVEQRDGSFKSSPWYVRFGKFQGVLKARERVVDINVNGVDASFQMYLDHKGEAFFLREIDTQEQEEEEDSSLMYPYSSGDDTDDQSLKSRSCYSDSHNGEVVVSRSSSRRSRILGLVFGGRSLKGQVEDGDGNREDSLERAEIAANLLDLKWSTSGKYRQNILATSSGADNIPLDNGSLHQGEAQDGERDPNEKEVSCVELESRIEKQFNGEEVSGLSTVVDAPGNDISEEDISPDGAHSLVYSDASECSKVGLDCSSEQAHDVMHLAGGGCEVCVHDDEVLHGATVLLSEGTETEDVTKNADLGMPVMEVSESHSQAQQTDCTDSDRSMYDVMDVEDLPTSPKSQTVNMHLGHCSTEKVESNYVTKPSSYNGQDDQTLDENNMRDKDISITLSSPPDYLGDCLPGKATRSPSPSSEEENFHFSDLDESRANDQFEGSFSPEYVDKEDDLSYENDTEKLRVISSPIVIPRNEAAEEVVEQHIISLPNISSCSDSLGQHVVSYPLSQSLDSKSASLLWTCPDKDDLKCQKSDEVKENQLSHEEPGAHDYHNSEEFESTVLKLPLGDPSIHNPSPDGNWRMWPFSRSRSRKAMLPIPRDAKNTTFDNSSENMISTDGYKSVHRSNLMKKKVTGKTPTSEQLASLNLKEGRNTVTFTFSTAVLGKQQVDAQIYLWKWNTRIVISDVDGTITRSDVLGQFMPLVGIDWSQTGVTHFFSAIKENGYQLLFLSARSIFQAYLTRQFLFNLKQDGKVLPDGPVVISPDGLFPSLYREVIRRVPHEFKIACLEDIKALFPSDCNPFYAGFGNRDTDEISYLKVGIPKGKIFIINPKGEIAVNRCLDTKSYTSLHALVNGMFPLANSSEQEDFNSWNYWKLSPFGIDI
ncbi:phosphatidate phosphatase PAH2-like [Gastrolobium bilobum]|uniref:phosphatidate phosphatase PAH2-like n=1 Tax=Gastrolobium bilobum TaxID=150636 RepID=UPI002AB12F0D|nr:phosphatidate phosphatase PAH2-like [Gastrolobium bilobum]